MTTAAPTRDAIATQQYSQSDCTYTNTYNVQVSTGFRPHKWQNYAFSKYKRFNAFACHRRFGKTVKALNALIHDACAIQLPLGRFGYICPYLKQARRNAWDYLRQYTYTIPGVKCDKQAGKIIFPDRLVNGKVILGPTIEVLGADNPDAIRGSYFDGVILDEPADMKAGVWEQIIRPMLTDRGGWATFIGTPKGYNLFSEIFFKAVKDPDWYAETFPISKTIDSLPWLTRKEMDLARRAMGETAFRQEYECDWNASCDNILITIDMINSARGKHHNTDVYNRQPVILGVDVARYGDDRSVIIRRQGLASWEPIIRQGLNNVEVAQLVAQEIKQHNPDAINIDAGRGEGVIDMLREWGYTINEINFGGTKNVNRKHKYKRKRDEMWGDMQEWFMSGGAIYDDEELVTSLVAPSYRIDHEGKLELESKDKLKERVNFSPDPGDALALTFAVPVAARDEFDLHRKAAQVGASQNYNPLA